MRRAVLRWAYHSPIGQRVMTSPMGDRVKRALPERLAITMQFHHHHGYFPNLRNPTTHSEWIQHRKLYDRDPRMPPLADKLTSKEIVAEILGADWIIPTLWSGTDPALIPFDALSPPYVVKANHACECNWFVYDAGEVDRDGIRAQAERWLRLDYGRRYHEWAYSQVTRQVLVEPFVGDGRRLPIDLKFPVFGGKVHHVSVTVGRGTEDRCDIYFDPDWTVRPAFTDGPIERWEIPAPPRQLPAMIAAAETLAAPFRYARVDLYEVGERPLFGEITFYPNAGYVKKPMDLDRMLGSLWRQ